MTKRTTNVRNLVQIAMCAAVAAVLMYFEFPLPFIAPPFYELDLSEVPVLIGTFSMGPVAGVVIELVKVLLKLLIKGTSTAYVGDFANFLMGCCFILPAGIIYKMNRTKKGALIGSAAGTLAMALAGLVFNALVLIPFYSKLYGLPLDVIIGMGTEINGMINGIWSFVLICVAPFNIIKGIVVSAITFLVYKRVRVIIH